MRSREITSSIFILPSEFATHYPQIPSIQYLNSMLTNLPVLCEDVVPANDHLPDYCLRASRPALFFTFEIKHFTSSSISPFSAAPFSWHIQIPDRFFLDRNRGARKVDRKVKKAEEKVTSELPCKMLWGKLGCIGQRNTLPNKGESTFYLVPLHTEHIRS